MISPYWLPTTAWETHVRDCLDRLTDDERHQLHDDWKRYGRGRLLVFWLGRGGGLIPVFMPLRPSRA